MAKSRSQKQEEVEKIVDAIEGAKGVVFADFAGLNVKATQDLRRRCRENDVRYTVTKKTLLKIAFAKAKVSVVDPKSLDGNISVVFGYEDEVSAAKLLSEFAKENEALTFVGGLIPEGEGWKYLEVSEITALSKLPTKHELIGQVVGTIAEPLRSFVGVLSGVPRSFVQVLKAIADNKV